MERLTRPCEDTENGRWLPYVVGEYVGISPNYTLGKVVEKLAYYENLQEEGRLIILSIEDIHPCRNCDTGWGSISSEGCHSCEEVCGRLKQYQGKYNKMRL